MNALSIIIYGLFILVAGFLLGAQFGVNLYKEKQDIGVQLSEDDKGLQYLRITLNGKVIKLIDRKNK
jgi:hypothetical protein